MLQATSEDTLVEAERFLIIAQNLSPDAEIIEDLGFCYLQKVKFCIEKNQYVLTKELSVARKYFEDAMALCVDSIHRCYQRIAFRYLEVLELLNLPMEYIKWFEELKQYIRDQKDLIHGTMALARFQSVLGIEITSKMGMLDQANRNRFYEAKTLVAGDYDSYLCLMQDRIDEEYRRDSGIQKEYLFTLFNAKKYPDFKSRLSKIYNEMNEVDQEVFSALLAEIDDPRLAEKRFIALTIKYDAIFAWNELLAFYRRHHNLDALVATFVDVQNNHAELIGPDPTSFFMTFFYTILDDIHNPNDAYIFLSRLESTLQQDFLWFLRMDLSQKVFCLSDTYILAKRIEETFAYKMNVTRERIAIIEYQIISLKFKDAERQMIEYRTQEDSHNLENSVIIQAYWLLKKKNLEVDLSLVNIDRFEGDVSMSLMFMSRFPEVRYIKDMKICLDLQTLAALYANDQFEYLLSAKEILINYVSMYQLFLLAAHVNGELLDNNLFIEMINWIIEHKDKIKIDGCSVDNYFYFALNPDNQKIFSLLEIDPYPEKIHILSQLPQNCIILMADKALNRTKHPFCVRLGENAEINILDDSAYVEFDTLIVKNDWV